MTAWALFDESQSPALLGLEAIVNFGPEGAEISNCGPKSEEYNHVQRGLAGSLEVGISRAKQKQGDRDDLCNHLDFSKFRGRDGKSLIGCDEPQSVDGNFTTDNDAHHPCLNQIELHEGNEYQGYQKLVRDRVQKNSQGSHLAALSGDISIEEIRDRGEQENDRGDQHIAMLRARQQNCDDQRNRKYSRERQPVRQIHGVILVHQHRIPGWFFGIKGADVARMKGLILAGGKGTRLRPLTINTPKPVVPVANAPFLLYQIDLMKSAGIDEIILSLSYQPRKIKIF